MSDLFSYITLLDWHALFSCMCTLCGLAYPGKHHQLPPKMKTIAKEWMVWHCSVVIGFNSLWHCDWAIADCSITTSEAVRSNRLPIGALYSNMAWLYRVLRKSSFSCAWVHGWCVERLRWISLHFSLSCFRPSVNGPLAPQIKWCPK